MLKESKPANLREVWIVNHYAITPDLPGGTRHYDFGIELAKMGYKVRIFVSDVNHVLSRHTKLNPGELYREESVNGVWFVWVRAAMYQKNDWRRAWNMLSFAFNACRVGLRVQDKPEVIIGSSPHPFAVLAAYAISRFKRSRFILEIRDLWPQALIDMGGMTERSIITIMLRLLERFLYKVAAKIIILALGSRDYLLEHGVASDKIVYIPNGVHLGNFKEATSRSEARKEFGFTKFTIVYTGAHGPANALDTILRAADFLHNRNDVEFVLVGDGPSKSALVEEATRLKLKNLRFMDPVPKARIPQLLAAADAAVITLRAVDAFSYGISPNKLFDYMASGKPVICSVPGDMAWLVRDNGAGLIVEPENPEALARAVEELLTMNQYERDVMGKRGRELVEKEFSREKLAERLMEIIIR